jgi:hypothetical protein
MGPGRLVDENSLTQHPRTEPQWRLASPRGQRCGHARHPMRAGDRVTTAGSASPGCLAAQHPTTTRWQVFVYA